MRGGNTDTPMMLDFCLRFPRCINELLKRVTGTSYRYFTNPVASYYLQPTLGNVDVNFCDLAKLPKPSSGCLTKKQRNELRQWTQQYGRSVRQNTTSNFSTKDKPGTLPSNLYESAPPEQHSVDFDVLLNEDVPAQQDTSTTHNVFITQCTYVVVSRMSVQTAFCSKQPTVYNKTIRRCRFTHLWHKGLLPVLFQSYFQYASSIHGYNTRYASKQNLYKPKERTNSGKQTVAFTVSVLWDNIPVDLKNLNVFNFSKKSKHYLLSEQHYETLS